MQTHVDKPNVAPAVGGAGPSRDRVREAAKRFKASWVELGKLLSEVHAQSSYAAWGYENFEAYCSKELHIRKQTAWKLVRAYSFLDKHDRKAVREPSTEEVAPPFEIVEVLADAEAEGRLQAHEYASIRDSIWNPDRNVAQLRREIATRFPTSDDEPAKDAHSLTRVLGMARRVASELAHADRVPKALVERARALVEDIEDLVKS